ncbi:MAG: conjugative transfer system coupling protein TraD [Burkholderiales bacterium]|jgi:conjugal transfer pilus assembly protein TraD
MKHEPINDHFRPAYEGRAAFAWGLAGFYALVLMAFVRIGWHASLAMFAMAAVMFAVRGWQTQKHWSFKLRLAGRPIELLPAVQLEKASAKLKDEIWLGWGFRWEPRHAQLAYEVLKKDMEEIYPPAWYLKWSKAPQDPRKAKGLPWVQGLEAERDVLLPFKALEGHTAIMAITGAIKTTFYKLLVYQFARRGDVVIVMDPKGDRDLQRICRDVPASLGHPERFVMCHPAFGSKSFRYDALAAWDRETQVASRIRMIMSASEDDNFVSYVWMTVTHIVGCMKRIGRRVSIATLLDHVQSQAAAEQLAERVIERFLQEDSPHHSVLVEARVAEMETESRKPRGRGTQISNPKLAALAEYFKFEVADSKRPREISGLVSALESNREWFSKMVVALTPILTKLSSGDLGPLLSPDYQDIEDERPIFNARKIIEGGYVAYFGLDALSDSSVAEAIAAMALADLAATAGEIYNYENPSSSTRKIHVVCDEWGDLVCEPLIQLANKARGANVVLYLAGQTFADLVVKLGDPNKARRVLGNCNNLIVGATSDKDTLDIVMSKFGETSVRSMSVAQGSGQKTEDTGLEYSATRTTSLKETVTDLVPPNVVMALPDLQYFAVVNRAQIYKGRVPVLTLEGSN